MPTAARPPPRPATPGGLALALALLAACGAPPPSASPTLAVRPALAALSPGQAVQLRALLSAADAGPADATARAAWRSSAEAVVEVSAGGLATALAPGVADVSAAVDGLEASARLTVLAPPPVLVAVAVRPARLELLVGDAAQAALVGTFDGGPEQDLTAEAEWAVGGEAVASVGDAGLVTALAPGATTLVGRARGLEGRAQVLVGGDAGYDPGQGWTLVWGDEFEGSQVDAASWTFDLGSGGWGNGESQFYRAENATVAGGVLTITARQEAFGDAPYTSARLQTSRKRAFTYGKFSMRARLPGTQAMWPAFWLLGASSNSFHLYGGDVTWPGCGEADAMELIGGLADGSGDFTTHGTLHYLDASGRNPAPSFAYRHPRRLSEQFHVYELVWTPHSFTWKFDGLSYGTRVIGADMEEFSKPMFILLNLAVGGAWGGWVNASTVFPQRYVIDWVRVYGNETTAPGGTAGLPTSFHLSSAAAAGAPAPGETLDPLPGTGSGFQPLKVLTEPGTWWSAPLTGRYEEGAWSVGVFTTSPGQPAVVRAEVLVTAVDGGVPLSLGTAQLDVNQTGLGNHRSTFLLTGVPALRLDHQRLQLVLRTVGGVPATMVYNGNDFDSALGTPWSPAP